MNLLINGTKDEPMKLSLDDKIEKLTAIGFVYSKDKQSYSLSNELGEHVITMHELVCMDDDVFTKSLEKCFKEAISVPEESLSSQLMKYQTIIKQACVDMLAIVGIHPSEITLTAASTYWRIEINGDEIFSCRLEDFIESLKGTKE
jgi:hypothetical protein